MEFQAPAASMRLLRQLACAVQNTSNSTECMQYSESACSVCTGYVFFGTLVSLKCFLLLVHLIFKTKILALATGELWQCARPVQQ